jgi:cell division protein FtsA
VGLLIKGLDDLEAGLIPAQAEEPAEEEVTVEKEPAGSNWYDQLFKRTKEWFEAEPDNEF